MWLCSGLGRGVAGRVGRVVKLVTKNFEDLMGDYQRVREILDEAERTGRM